MTMFVIGQLVEAKMNSQGMIEGQVFIVRSVNTVETAFGTVYAECIVESDAGKLLTIRNAHLLLDHS